jgi:hypothetical protein
MIGARTFLERFRHAAGLLVLLSLCIWATRLEAKPDISSIKAAPITIESAPIRSFTRSGSADARVNKLTFRGGLVLRSPSPVFGGWSGLIVDDDGKRFLAISDIGAWMSGKFVYEGVRPTGIEDARLGPLLGRDGATIKRSRDRDSESIALENGTLEHGSLLVGFERRHRIERFPLTAAGPSASIGSLPLPATARRMRANQGLEAITVMKGGPNKGSVVAFAERLYDASRNHTGWLWTSRGPETIHLKNIGDYDVTDLSSLDDGTLFVLERRFRWLEGVKMRLVRVAPDALRAGRTIEGETLIEADLNDEIDNMEGLSVTRLKSGEVLVTMISDDNFNTFLQRTLLLQFTVDDTGQAKARPQN